MASIVQRNNRYNVVYLYDDEATGKRKQKWESFKTMADAKRRKAEIEYRQEIGTMVIHQCKTVDELLKEYVALYGKTTWSMSVYGSKTALIEHYISPIIGSMKLSDVTARVLEKYYMQLLKTPSVHRITQKANSKNVIYVAPPTVRKIHNILRSAFHQAVKWELMEKNPAMYATVPKSEAKKREIWDAPTLFHSIGKHHTLKRCAVLKQKAYRTYSIRQNDRLKRSTAGKRCNAHIAHCSLKGHICKARAI